MAPLDRAPFWTYLSRTDKVTLHRYSATLSAAHTFSVKDDAMSDDTTQTGNSGCTCGRDNCHDNLCLPEVTFSTFIMSMASSGLVQLGEVPNPEDGTTQTDLLMAKHSIDILTMLQEKTRNCLEPDEARLLEGLLYELRMKYVMKRG